MPNVVCISVHFVILCLTHSPFKNQILNDWLYNSSSPTVRREPSEFAFVFQESECAWERPWLAWNCFSFWPPLYRISIWNLRLIPRILKLLQWPVLLAACHLHTSYISFLVKEQTGCCFAGVCDFFPEAWPSSFSLLGIPLSFILSHLSLSPQPSEHPSFFRKIFLSYHPLPSPVCNIYIDHDL